jgi:hypothetical protein
MRDTTFDLQKVEEICKKYKKQVKSIDYEHTMQYDLDLLIPIKLIRDIWKDIVEKELTERYLIPYNSDAMKKMNKLIGIPEDVDIGDFIEDYISSELGYDGIVSERGYILENDILVADIVVKYIG